MELFDKTMVRIFSTKREEDKGRWKKFYDTNTPRFTGI